MCKRSIDKKLVKRNVLQNDDIGKKKEYNDRNIWH